MLGVTLLSTNVAGDEPMHVYSYIQLFEDDHVGDPVVFAGETLDPDHSLIVSWDEEALRAALAPGASLPVTEETRLATLRNLTEAFFATQAALIRLTAQDDSSTDFVSAQNAFSEAGQHALKLSQEYSNTLRAAGHASAATTFRAAVNALLLEEHAYLLLAEAMTREIEALNARVARLLATAPKRRVQMRARLVGALGTRRLHLDGYDTYQTYDPVETPRFQFELDKRAQREIEAADELGDVVHAALSGDLQQELETALASLKTELQDLRTGLETDALEVNVHQTVREMEVSADDGFGPAIAAGETLVHTLQSLQLSTPDFSAESDVQLLLLIYRTVTAQIGEIVAQLRGLESGLQAFTDTVETTAAEVPGVIADEVRETLLESLERVKNDPNIATVIERFETVRRSLGLTTEVAEAGLDGAETARDLDKSFDTRLDLLVATPGRRYSGDLVVLEALIFEGEGDNARVLTRGYRKIRLQQVGLRGEVRGALVFTDPQNAEYDDQAWEPTVALGYMLHYGMSSNSFWNTVLDPGIGLSMTVLDWQEDHDFEVGIGINVSLLQNLLWIGYGRNLQAETDYSYVGINPLAAGRLFRGTSLSATTQ